MLRRGYTVEQLYSMVAGCESRIEAEEAMKAEFARLLAEKNGVVRQHIVELQNRTLLLSAILRGEGCGGNEAEVLRQAGAELRLMLDVATGVVK